MKLLEANGISMHFGGVQAVANLDLTLEEGPILGIIGHNGSGKTTFFNVLTGIYRPTGGAFTFKGQDVTGWPAHQIAKQGIARTFQNIRLFGQMSVLDNVLVGAHCHVNIPLWRVLLHGQAKDVENIKAREKAQELLHFVDLEDRADEYAVNLAYGAQRRVELARALAGEPDMLLLDEPTAGMNDSEASHVMDLIRKIQRKGVTILLIEHNMKVMMGTAERIVALDAGRKIAEGSPREIQYNEEVIKAYLGEEEE